MANTFKAVCRLYAAKRNLKQKRKEGIALGDLERIYTYLVSESTATDSRHLTRAVRFMLAFNFGCLARSWMRGREINR